MAERRMISKTIIDSDSFLAMPLSAQALYIHICIRADDDGFVNCVKKIQRMISASEADIDILVEKGYLIAFESGIYVVTHWKVHNSIQKDRYKETLYKNEKAQIKELVTRVYTLDTGCIQHGSISETQARKGEASKGQHSEERMPPPDDGYGSRFIPPSIDEIRTFCEQEGYSIDAERFWAFYQSNGWMVGKNKMCDWKASVRTWVLREKPQAELESQSMKSCEPDILDGIL